ncbi:MAG: RsmB/NOP family class I SAM-dependent RNA methyltransferase [Muribaculaceae bacterium]
MIQLPQGFVDSMASREPREDYLRLIDALASSESPVSVRLNRAKGADESLFDGAERVNWCDDGLYLATRPQFTLDPALHQGLYYVQDASSMAQKSAVALACSLMDISERSLRYLDACAAPGGKTTAAMSALPADAFVVANEFDPKRTSILIENLAKWGRPAVVTRGDASAVKGLDNFFDIVAADVPCSGEGMMRKDPKAVAQWSEGLIESCAARQLAIVESLWRALRPGGIMIYSTCTFNLAENEDIVAHLIADHDASALEIPELERCAITKADPGCNFPAYHFLPGVIRGEGLFIAMLRKPGDSDPAKPKAAKLKPAKGIEAPLTGDWVCVAEGNAVRAIPTAHADLTAAVAAAMHTVASGIELGEIKGRDFIPAQPLAMATDLRRDVYAEVEVDRDTALQYLRREAICLDSPAPRGIVLLTYRNRPLGFVKNLGNRANNLYPAQWRILSQIH